MNLRFHDPGKKFYLRKTSIIVLTMILVLSSLCCPFAVAQNMETVEVGEVIVDLDNLEETSLNGHSIYSVQLRGDIVFIMAYETKELMTPIRFWRQYRHEKLNPEFYTRNRAEGSLLDLVPSYLMGASRFNFPVTFWMFNWKTKEASQIAIDTVQKTISQIVFCDISPNGRLLKVIDRAHTIDTIGDRSALYKIDSQRVEELGVVNDIQFLWHPTGNIYFWLSRMKDINSGKFLNFLFSIDEKGKKRELPLSEDLSFGSFKIETWLNESNLLLKRRGIAYELNIESGQIREMPRFFSANRIGPYGKSWLEVSGNSYELLAEGIQGSLIKYGPNPGCSYALDNMAWSPSGERLYAFSGYIPYIWHIPSGQNLALPGDEFITDFRLAAGWDGEYFYCLKYDATLQHTLLVRYTLEGERRQQFEVKPVQGMANTDVDSKERFSTLSDDQIKELAKEKGFHVLIPSYLPPRFKALPYGDNGKLGDLIIFWYGESELSARSAFTPMPAVFIEEDSTKEQNCIDCARLRWFYDGLQLLGDKDYTEDRIYSYKRVNINGEDGIVMRDLKSTSPSDKVDRNHCLIMFIANKETMIRMRSDYCGTECENELLTIARSMR